MFIFGLRIKAMLKHNGHTLMVRIYYFFCEGGKASDGNLISFIKNDFDKDKKYEYFVVDKADGLTKAGLSSLNQSIEAFIYCILGAQVNVRSTVVGNSSLAQEVRN